MRIASTSRQKPQINQTKAAPKENPEVGAPDIGRGSDDKLDLLGASVGGAAGGAMLLSIPLMLCGFSSSVGETIASSVGLGHTGAKWAGLAATLLVGGLSGAGAGIAYVNSVEGSPSEEIHEKVTKETFGEPFVGLIGAGSTGLLLGLAGANGLPIVGLAAGALLSTPKNRKMGAAAGFVAGAAAATLAATVGGGTLSPYVNTAASLLVGGAAAGLSRAVLVNEITASHS